MLLSRSFKSIAVVGCSIAGSAFAANALRLGYPKEKLQIFDRAQRDTLKDRGAGIGLPTDLVRTLNSYFSSTPPLRTYPITRRIDPEAIKTQWDGVLRRDDWYVTKNAAFK